MHLSPDFLQNTTRKLRRVLFLFTLSWVCSWIGVGIGGNPTASAEVQEDGFFTGSRGLETQSVPEQLRARLSPETLAAVPDSLKGWIGWSLRDQEADICPRFENREQCTWYSGVKIRVKDKGLTFGFTVAQAREGLVRLPGGQHWPLAVTANGTEVPVSDRGGLPFISLEKGTYRIAGKMVWERKPTSVLFPPAMGFAELKESNSTSGTEEIRGLDLSLGQVGLGAQALEALSQRSQIKQKAVQNAVRVEVFRLISDGQPVRLTTRLSLSVSGSARELSVPGVTLQDFEIVQLNSPLPVKMAADGTLKVKAKAGRWTVDILSVRPQPVSVLEARPFLASGQTSGQISGQISGQAAALDNKRQKTETVFVNNELWTFQPQAWLRRVRVSGAQSVDPTKTAMPEEWKKLQAYLIDADTPSLTLTSLSRGEEAPKPDALNLARRFWYDFSGNGWTIEDMLSGQVNRSSRLEVNPQTRLGSVEIDGQPQLVSILKKHDADDAETDTTGTDATGTDASGGGNSGRSGVGVQRGNLNLTSQARYTGGLTRVPAVGWTGKIQNLSATVHMPPGWRVLHVSGPQSVDNSWVSQWSLLDMFLVLLAAGAVARWLGITPGFVALVSLVLVHFDVRLLAASLVFIVIIDAFRRFFVPERGFWAAVFRWVQRGVLFGVALTVTVFIVGDVRRAVFPQTENFRTDYEGVSNKSIYSGFGQNSQLDQLETEEVRPVSPEPATRTPRALSSLKSAPQRREVSKIYYQQKIGLLNQTGEGLANWRSSSEIRMRWDGPVTAGQTFSVWALSPFAGLAVSFIKSLLLLLLVAFFAYPNFIKTGKPPSGTVQKVFARLVRTNVKSPPPTPTPTLTAAVPAAVMALALLVPGNQVMAQETGGQQAPVPQASAPQASDGSPVSEFPEKYLLDQLKAHLTADLNKTDFCQPQCGQVDSVSVASASSVTSSSGSPLPGTELQVKLGFSALAATAVRMPLFDGWVPTRITLNGGPAKVFGFSDGGRFVLVPKGTGAVLLTGPLDQRRPVSISSMSRIKNWTVEVDGMAGAGGNKDATGRLLTLTPVTPVIRETESVAPNESVSGDGAEGMVLSNSFVVHRRLAVGLTWDLQTVLMRSAGTDRAASVSVPLLDNERPLGENLSIAGQRITLNFANGQETAEWRSTLDPVPQLSLTARAEGPPELWSVQTTNLWHLESGGLPLTVAPAGGRGRGGAFRSITGRLTPDPSTRHFVPWPGETLVLRFIQPLAADGLAMNIDRSNTRFSIGRNLTKATVDLRMTSSLGGRHPFVLPAGASDPSVRVNGQGQPLVVETKDGRDVLILSFGPGRHQIQVAWEQANAGEDAGEGAGEGAGSVSGRAFRLSQKTPGFNLSGLSVNNVISSNVPQNRWLLWARLSPNPDPKTDPQTDPKADPKTAHYSKNIKSVGPAILIWGFIPVALVLAFLLAFFTSVPMRTAGWFVLLAGLSQVNFWASVFVVIFLVAVSLMPHSGLSARTPVRYNMRQVFILGWTGITVLVLLSAIQSGLLSSPDMKVAGFRSTARQLNWFIDRWQGEMPSIELITAPVWLYRLLMLLWALWLAYTLLRLAKWFIAQVTHDGVWQKMSFPGFSRSGSGQKKAESTTHAVSKKG